MSLECWDTPSPKITPADINEPVGELLEAFPEEGRSTATLSGMQSRASNNAKRQIIYKTYALLS